jgi:hypothetical protein
VIPGEAEWETKLYKTERSFRIGDKPAGLLSQAINPDDGLVLAIQAFLLENAIRVGDEAKTIEKHAYIVCVWYDYLRLKNIDVFDAHEGHLRDFLLAGGVRYGNVHAIGKQAKVSLDETNLTKLNTLIAFYDFWERKRGKTLRTYRGLTLARLNEELFTRRHRRISSAKFNYSKAEISKSKKHRPTPTIEEGALVLDRALEQKDQNRAQTWYLIGSVALRAGSRVLGIHSLTVQKLLQGLANERSFRTLENYKQILKGYLKEQNRRTIVQTLQRMSAEHRKFIYCDVQNKGGGFVPIAIPIELCVEIIDYLCTCREEVIRTRFAKAKIVPPDNVFLSYKIRAAGGALQPESMSNRYKKLFNELILEGSIHRLRASFCEDVVRDVYIRERAVNGRAWQRNNVLEFARKLLGHKSQEPLESYLNNIEASEILSGDPVMVECKDDTPYIRALCVALTGQNGEQVREAIRDFTRQLGIQPLYEENRRYALF